MHATVNAFFKSMSNSVLTVESWPFCMENCPILLLRLKYCRPILYLLEFQYDMWLHKDIKKYRHHLKQMLIWSPTQEFSSFFFCYANQSSPTLLNTANYQELKRMMMRARPYTTHQLSSTSLAAVRHAFRSSCRVDASVLVSLKENIFFYIWEALYEHHM